MKAAVIGTGLAAAALAEPLTQAGWQLSFFEKSRGTGGRMTTRRREGVYFDHGAQYFTARTTQFQQFLKLYFEAGLVQEWTPRVQTLAPGAKPYKRLWYEPHYVCVPTMNSLCRTLLGEQSLHFQHRVESVRKSSRGWQVLFEEGGEVDGFDWVISTAPASQTLDIFGSVADELSEVKFEPGFALMGLLPHKPGWDAAVVKSSAIDWMVLADARPGRPEAQGLVAQATGPWSMQHLEEPPERVQEALMQALSDLNLQLSEPQLHRWRFARAIQPLGKDFWCDPDSGLAACGDWCLGNRVEDAYTSAVALARLLNQSRSDLCVAQLPAR